MPGAHVHREQAPRGHSEEGAKERGLRRNKTCHQLHLGLQPPELWEVHSCCLHHPGCGSPSPLIYLGCLGQRLTRTQALALSQLERQCLSSAFLGNLGFFPVTRRGLNSNILGQQSLQMLGSWTSKTISVNSRFGGQNQTAEHPGKAAGSRCHVRRDRAWVRQRLTCVFRGEGVTVGPCCADPGLEPCCFILVGLFHSPRHVMWNFTQTLVHSMATLAAMLTNCQILFKGTCHSKERLKNHRLSDDQVQDSPNLSVSLKLVTIFCGSNVGCRCLKSLQCIN